MNYDNHCTYIGNTLSWQETGEPVYLCENHIETGHYVLGKTGSGKSTYLEHLIRQDMQDGLGLTLFDFHGDIQNRILQMIPNHRINDVIYIDPTDPKYSVGLNILSGIDPDPDARKLYANTLFEIFYTLWGPDAKAASWGPRLVGILKNAIRALSYMPNATILGIERMLTGSMHHSGLTYRDHVLNHCKDPLVVKFWRERFDKWTVQERTTAIEAVLNKWDELISHPGIRYILAQTHSTIDIRKAIANQKIIIVNLAKGRLGSQPAHVFASLLTTKYFHDILTTVDIANPEDRTPHKLYIDEFQNLEISALKAILSEARKFRLSLVLAHQFTEQLTPDVIAAIFGNLKSASIFSVGGRDIQNLERDVAQVMLHIKEHDHARHPAIYEGPADYDTALHRARDRLATIEDHHCLTWYKDGQDLEMEYLQTLPPLQLGSPKRAALAIKQSRKVYSVPRVDIEKQILQFSAADMKPVQAPSTKAPRGRPQISVQAQTFYLNKAFCFDHELEQPCYVTMQYSQGEKSIRFAFGSNKSKGAQALTFKNGAAQLSHKRLAVQAKLNLDHYQGVYDPARIYADELSYEQIKLKPCK